jgi:hypothetical protein
MARETWMVQNRTGNSLCIGDLPSVPAIPTNKQSDLLRYTTKDKINQSVNLKQMLDAGWLRLIKTKDSVKTILSKSRGKDGVDTIEDNELKDYAYSKTEVDNRPAMSDERVPIDGSVNMDKIDPTIKNAANGLTVLNEVARLTNRLDTSIHTNRLIVYPGDVLQTAYDWLKSSDRDTQMGAVTTTARRYLIRKSGAYTGDLSVDTKYVYVVDEDGVTDTGSITYTTAWYGTIIGDGSGDSEANALNIDSPEAYKSFVSTTGDYGKTFAMTADIDFGGSYIKSITVFTGSWYGNTYKLKNYVINNPGLVKNHNALFHASSGSIYDLYLDGKIIASSPNTSTDQRSYVAHLVAEHSYGGVIDNCHVSGEIYHTHTGTLQCYIGCIVGSNHGTVVNCTSRGVVSLAATTICTYVYFGGLVGYQTGGAGGGEVGSCTDSISTSTLILRNDTCDTSVLSLGGVAGEVTANGAINTITNCHWHGVIDARWSYATSNFGYIGGIVGLQNSTISNCSSKGSMMIVASPSNWLNVGGGIGRIPNGSAVTDSCFADIEMQVGGTTDWAGGFVGACYEQITNCYALGSIYDLDTGGTALELDYYGGFAGRFVAETIDNCWCAIDTYTVGAGSYIQGFAGYVHTSSDLNDCFWDSDTSSIVAANADASATSTANMMVTATFTNYDFTHPRKWKHIDGYDYPKLDWEE